MTALVVALAATCVTLGLLLVCALVGYSEVVEELRTRLALREALDRRGAASARSFASALTTRGMRRDARRRTRHAGHAHGAARVPASRSARDPLPLGPVASDEVLEEKP